MNLNELQLITNPWVLVDQFETDLGRDPKTNLDDYLPSTDDAEYLEILVELIRLDLEFAKNRQGPREPDYYFARYPELREEPSLAAIITFEAYRLLKQIGASIEAEDYAKRYGVSCAEWPKLPKLEVHKQDTRLTMPRVTPYALRYSRLLRQLPAPELEPSKREAEATNSSPLQSLNPNSWDPNEQTFCVKGGSNSSEVPLVTSRVSSAEVVPDRSVDVDSLFPRSGDPFPPKQAPINFPSIGEKFLNFELRRILGNGSFGRVYLAAQADLADRLVAIKLGRGLFLESNTLAQLQHTNIVPIFSMHTSADIQAICMPFFGSCTLSHWLKEVRESERFPITGGDLINRLQLDVKDAKPTQIANDHNLLPTTVNGSSESILRQQPVQEEPSEVGCLGTQWQSWSSLPYTKVVVQILSQLTSGLEHAHTRGIVHSDLKPANILISNDAMPMLLDFNVARDLKCKQNGKYLVIGGTLPYMAPEQLQAYLGKRIDLDHRLDLYALGILLFELLTGQRPFSDKASSDTEAVAEMIRDRSGQLPSVKNLNPEVTYSLESIIHKLLAFEPATRYQTATDLQDDLTRFLADLPLRHAIEPSYKESLQKWFRRNRWARSIWTIAAAAILAMVACTTAMLAVRERSRSLESYVSYEHHFNDFRDLQYVMDDRSQGPASVQAGLQQCNTILGRYGLSTSQAPKDGWQQSVSFRYLPDDCREQIRESLGEVYYLMAKAAARKAEITESAQERTTALSDATRWNKSAEVLDPTRIRRALLQQRQELLNRTGQEQQAIALGDEIKQLAPHSARDRYLLGYWHYQQGRLRQALPELMAATYEDSTHFSAWFVRGITHLQLEQNDLASMCFTAGIALRPDFAPAWANRGKALIKLRKYELARADFQKVLSIDPNKVEALILLGGAFQARVGGPRLPDTFEGTTGNNTSATATQLTGVENISIDADLSLIDTTDFYRFTVPTGAKKAVINLQTSGLSMLTANIQVIDASGKVVDTDSSTDPTNGDLSIKLDGLKPGQVYTIRVANNLATGFATGRYQLSLEYGKEKPQKQSYVKDEGDNDTLNNASSFSSSSRSNSQRNADRFFANAVIENKADVDFYRLKPPPTVSANNSTLIIQLRSLGSKQLLPQIAVYDSQMRLIPSHIVTQSDSSVVLQVNDISRFQELFVRVQADGTDSTKGNYRLRAEFTSPLDADLIALQRGTLSNGNSTSSGTLTVTTNSLFQFTLNSTQLSTTQSAQVRLDLVDSNGKIIASITQSSGSDPVSLTKFLAVGTYQLRFTLLTPRATSANVTFWLDGGIFSDPMGPRPTTVGSTPISTSPPTPPPTSPPASPPPPTNPAFQYQPLVTQALASLLTPYGY